MTIQRQPSLRRLDWHYMAMQIGFWAMFASIVGYQTALLLDRGFSNGEAGLMTSVRCLAGIVCQPLLGGFADRHPEFPLKRIVSLSMLLSLGVSVWYWLAPGMGLGGDRPGVGGHRRAGGVLLSTHGRHGHPVHQRRRPHPLQSGPGTGLPGLGPDLCVPGLPGGALRGGEHAATHVVLVAAEDRPGGHLPAYRAGPAPGMRRGRGHSRPWPCCGPIRPLP